MKKRLRTNHWALRYSVYLFILPFELAFITWLASPGLLSFDTNVLASAPPLLKGLVLYSAWSAITQGFALAKIAVAVDAPPLSEIEGTTRVPFLSD
jgi:hypothetical protein